MGNENALIFCLSMLNEDINKQDEFGYPSDVEKDAYYIRQSESLDLLIKMFDNNSLVRDISKPSIKGHIGYLSLGYIEMFIENFPKEFLKKEKTNSNEKMTYNEKTKIIRNWLKENRDNLIIDKNHY